MVGQILVNGLIAGSIYGLVGLGFGLIYSTSRFFHFAHGAVYAVGAYLTYVCWLSGLSLYAAIPLAVIGTSILGALLDIGVYRPLRNKGASSLILLIASLGLFTVIQNLISLVFGDDTKTIRSGAVTEGLPLFGARITPIQIAIITVSALLILLCWALMKKTKIGKAMRAVANDPELARVIGIESDRVILFTFALGSALAAVAAGAHGLIIEVHPNPDTAWSDGAQSLTFENFNDLMKGVRAVAGALGRRMPDEVPAAQAVV